MLRSITVLCILMIPFGGCQLARNKSIPSRLATSRLESETKKIVAGDDKRDWSSIDHLTPKQASSKIELVSHSIFSWAKSDNVETGMGVPQKQPTQESNVQDFDSIETAPPDPDSLSSRPPVASSNKEPTAEFTTAEPINYPIDLPTAIGLAGADNWNVRLARERINEAAAQYTAAKALWLPTLNFGLGYNHHEGQIQETGGPVLQVSRGSLFVGGGAGISQAPLTGGSGGPARLFIDLSLADAIFEPLYRCQLVRAARSNERAVFNKTQLDAGSAYYELVRAQAQIDIAQRNLQEANVVLETTQRFVDAGKGAPADTSRMKVIVERRKQDLIRAQAQIGIAANRLATILQLDLGKLPPGSSLVPMDASPIPTTLVDEALQLDAMVQKAVCCRPEIRKLQSEVAAAQRRVKAEAWRPALPNIHVGGSGGGFGGGEGSDLPKLDGRFDMDVIVAWQIKNMGVGVKADRRLRASQLSQANMLLGQVRDFVVQQVTEAYHEIIAGVGQVEAAEDNLANATDAMVKTVERIRGLEGDPLELIQSVEAMAQTRNDYLDAVIDYNIAQLKMLQATGEGAR